MTSEDIYKSLEKLTLNNIPAFTKSFKKVLSNCMVPKFDKGDERPLDNKDFHHFKAQNEMNIYYIKLIWEDLIKKEFFNEKNESANYLNNDNEILMLSLVIIGENHNEFLWNTPNSIAYCQELLKIIVQSYGYENVSQLLVPKGGPQTIFKNILLHLRPKLLSNTWKCHPAAVQCYKWTLFIVPMPELSSFLNYVLPTALLLVDDFVNENRITGVYCLQHIINNVTAAELKFHGHGDVIYKALEPLLRTREAELIAVLLPCMVTLLTKLEMNLGDKEDDTKWSLYDDVLEICLENMELEHLVALRDAYIQNLFLLIKSRGIKIIRWSRRLFRVFKEYLEVAGNHNDLKTMKYCLEAVENYLQISKPVVHLYSNIVLFMLCKTLYNITQSQCNSQNRQEVKEKTVLCIQLVLDQLPQADREQLKKELTVKMTKNEQCSQFFNLLQSII